LGGSFHRVRGYYRGVTIRFLKNISFEISRPRLGYWIDIIPLRFRDNERLSFAIGAQDLNGVLSSRQCFLISEIFSSISDAQHAWRNGFRVPNYSEHFGVEHLVIELLNAELALSISESAKTSAGQNRQGER
jgi:hypothetical protein